MLHHFLLTPYSSPFLDPSEFKGNMKRGNVLDNDDDA